MICFDSVCKKYADDEGYIFDDFSETIEDGEFILLTGESGSGKSTLIKMLLKEVLPDSGRISVGDRDLSLIPEKGIPYYRRGLGVIFQDFKLFDEYTVFGNLELALSLTGSGARDTEKRVTDLLKLLNIDRLFKRYPRELSGGEKQKVCMARALINDPEVLLADEPTGNLDPYSTEEIIKLLEVVHRRGKTVIMATHDYDTAASLISSARRIHLKR